MRLVRTTKTIGITIKFVIEADEDLAERLLKTLPSDITFGGEHLWNVRIGMRGDEIEPVRVSICRDDMSMEEEDTFLDNG